MSYPRVAFANPGHLPWMVEAAATFDRLGVLSAYFGPAALPAKQIDRASRIPGPIGRRLASELHRRMPAGVHEARIRRAGSFSELAAVGAKRIGVPTGLARTLADRRDAAFDRGTSRQLSTIDADAIALGFGAASRTARSAKRVRTLLDYPLTHHRFAGELLREEARLQPRYAGTLQFHDYPRSRERRLDLEISLVDRVLVMSDYAKETFEDAGVSSHRLAVLPFGVDLDLFAPDPRPEQSDRPFRVLFVGQITQRKGISYLLEGFNAARESDWELLMVGTPVGGPHSWVHQPGVASLPWIRQHELPALYRTADVFVLPSLIEGGFPRVTLEAMACGLPVVITPAGGSADALTSAREGIPIPMRDADGIASALSRLSSDVSARKAMGKAARRRAECFSWMQYAASLSSIIREIDDV